MAVVVDEAEVEDVLLLDRKAAAARLGVKIDAVLAARVAQAQNDIPVLEQHARAEDHALVAAPDGQRDHGRVAEVELPLGAVGDVELEVGEPLLAVLKFTLIGLQPLIRAGEIAVLAQRVEGAGVVGRLGDRVQKLGGVAVALDAADQRPDRLVQREKPRGRRVLELEIDQILAAAGEQVRDALAAEGERLVLAHGEQAAAVRLHAEGGVNALNVVVLDVRCERRDLAVDCLLRLVPGAEGEIGRARRAVLPAGEQRVRLGKAGLLQRLPLPCERRCAGFGLLAAVLVVAERFIFLLRGLVKQHGRVGFLVEVGARAPDALQGRGVVLPGAAHQLPGAQVGHALLRHLPAVQIVAEGLKGRKGLLIVARTREAHPRLIEVLALHLLRHLNEQPDREDQQRHDDRHGDQSFSGGGALFLPGRLRAQRLALNAPVLFAAQRRRVDALERLAHAAAAVAARLRVAVDRPAGAAPEIGVRRHAIAAVAPVADAELLGELVVAVMLLERRQRLERRPEQVAEPGLLAPLKVHAQHAHLKGARVRHGQQHVLLRAELLIPRRLAAVAVGQLEPERRAEFVHRLNGDGHAPDAHLVDDLQREPDIAQLALLEQLARADPHRRAFAVQRDRETEDRPRAR